MSKITASNTTKINAPLSLVWEVLTSPIYSVHYMFNCEVITSWEVGTPIEWKGNYNGYDAHQIGEVLEFSPKSKLSYTTFDPNFGLENIPENYIHVDYALEEVNGITHLTISNTTFDGNKERFGHIVEGWKMVAPLIAKTSEEAHS